MDIPFKIDPGLGQDKIKAMSQETVGLAKKDPEILSLMAKFRLTDAALEKDVGLLRRYFNENRVCEGCKRFSSCPKKEEKGYSKGITFDPYRNCFDLYSKVCQPFSLVKKRLDLYAYSDIDPVDAYFLFSQTNLILSKKDTSKTTNTFLKVGRKIYEASKNYDPNKLNQGYFVSSVNTNGQCLLIALSYLFAKKGLNVGVLDFEHLSSVSFQDGEISPLSQEIVQKAGSVKALFIIGMGKEKPNASFKKSLLIPLLQLRQEKGDITFFSSHLSLEDYVSSYHASFEELASLIGPLIGNTENQEKIVDLAFF